jgi:hypothetical protein
MVKYTGVPAAVVAWVLGHGRIRFSPIPKRLGRAKEVFASLHFRRKPISLVAVERQARCQSLSSPAWLLSGPGMQAGASVDFRSHGRKTAHRSRQIAENVK